MEYILQMTFLTERGSKSAFSLSGVKPDASQAQVNAIMDLIINKKHFHIFIWSFSKKSWS